MTRGNRKECIFQDDIDYSMYLRLLEESVERFSATCNAYCLIWNHAHLLITPHEQPLWRVMHHLNSDYCRWFDARHGLVGHVTQGRYSACLIDDGYYFLNAVRYLAMNPVEARKVSHPEHWPWGSYRYAMGLAPAPRFLDLTATWAGLETEDEVEGRRRLAAFLASGESVYDWCDVMFGSEFLAARLRPMIAANREVKDFTKAQRFALRPALPELLAGVERGPELDRAVGIAFKEHGYTLREIGDYLGRPTSTIWLWVHKPRRQSGRACDDPAWND